MFKTTALIAALNGLVSANNTPIYGSYPGYSIGSGATGIEIELFFDYLCSACQSENPVIEKLLQEEWLGGTVADQVTVRYTPFPLPYHTHAYQVNQLVPYFMDLCIADSTQCFNNEYRDFSYDNLSTILSMKTTSQDDFITWWSTQVATEFGLDAATVEASYTDTTYATDSSLRSMWKYAAGKGVHATPTAFLNGAYVDSVPFTVRGWMKLLNETYDSQYAQRSAAVARIQADLEQNQ